MKIKSTEVLSRCDDFFLLKNKKVVSYGDDFYTVKKY